MANNRLDKVYLDKTKLNTLAGGGTLTSGTDTYTADENALYLVDDTSVLYETQTLTTEQKSQARTNIGLGTAAVKNSTTSVTSGSSDLVTSGAVYTAIDNLPEPMVFKGSLGTGGTITSLPTAASSNEGYTYKVITAGTYASQSAKVGDTFISTGSEWVLIPSGDEPSGTVTSVGVSAASGSNLSVSGSPVTSNGTITVGVASGYSIPSTSDQSTWSAKQNALPTSTTSGQVLKSTSTAGIVEWGNIPVTDVQVNGTSVLSSGAANILTNTAYNASSNKIATMSDIPSVSGKLDKVSTANTVYGVDGSGNQTNYSVVNASNTGNAIPKYDSSARLKAYTPSANDDVANKKYVDDNIPSNYMIPVTIDLSSSSGTLSSSVLATITANPQSVIINGYYLYSAGSSTKLYYSRYSQGTDNIVYIYSLEITISSGAWTRTMTTYYGGTSQFGSNAYNSTTIPTSVNGLSGGKLTSPLQISGGDATTASKIALDHTASGQITDDGTGTLFGFLSNNATTLTVGGNSYALNLRGSGTKPQYKGNDLALYSDVPSVWSGTQAQYDAIQNKDSNTYYFIEEE